MFLTTMAWPLEIDGGTNFAEVKGDVNKHLKSGVCALCTL